MEINLFARRRKLMYVDIIEDRPKTEAETAEFQRLEQLTSDLLGEMEAILVKIAIGEVSEKELERLVGITEQLWGTNSLRHKEAVKYKETK